MKIARIQALMKKEVLQAYQDPSSILSALVFPLVLLFLYGYGVSLDMHGIKIGVATEDAGGIGKSLSHAITETGYFRAETLLNRAEADAKLSSGNLDGYVVIPSYFTNNFLSKEKSAPLQLIADGSSPNTAKFVNSYTGAILANWLKQYSNTHSIPAPPGAEIIPRIWYNQELESNNFLIPGSIVIVMTVTGALLTSLVIAREWERGTMETLMSTPVSMEEIVISKLITYFLLGVASMIVCFLAARYVYGVPFRGSYFWLILTSTAYLLFALNTGLLISISIPDQFAASQVAIVVTYLPAFILSGFIYDIASMPAPLRFLTRFVPARYFTESLKTLFLVGDVTQILLPNVLVMSAFSAALAILIKRQCVKRIG